MRNAHIGLAGMVLALVLLPSCGLFRREQQPLDFVIIDTLAKELYDELHIKGAISIPFVIENVEENPALLSPEAFKKEVEARTGGALDKSTKLFFYCADEMCTSSKTAADAAASWGYNAKEYDSGIKGWLALSLYGPNKDQYKLEPLVSKGMTFKQHTYLNSVLTTAPDNATLNKWQSDAQPLIDAMKSS